MTNNILNKNICINNKKTIQILVKTILQLLMHNHKKMILILFKIKI